MIRHVAYDLPLLPFLRAAEIRFFLFASGQWVASRAFTSAVTRPLGFPRGDPVSAKPRPRPWHPQRRL